jgi:uncharacterized protein
MSVAPEPVAAAEAVSAEVDEAQADEAEVASVEAYEAEATEDAAEADAADREDGEQESAFGVAAQKTCVLSISTLEVVLPDVNPQLTLQEMDPPFRQLRIPIGQAEGVAIAYARRQIRTPRPLTHDLLMQVMEANGMVLEVVRITGVEGSSFSGEIIVSGPNGQQTYLCRVSDAVALTLRQKVRAPIVATEEVMSKAGGHPD